jgi:hypothetical protein
MIEHMYEESRKLRHMKYGVPKVQQNETIINDKIAQIQYLATLIAADRSEYKRMGEHRP